MTAAVEYALIALLAGAVAALAVAAREVAKLARTAEMIYALLYYSKPAAEEEAPQAAEAAVEVAVERQAAAQPPPATEGAQAPLGADECVVDLVRRYGCVSLADVRLKCGVGVYVLRRLKREGKIKMIGDRVCPK